MLVDVVSMGIILSYTFQNVTENHEITASFDLVSAVVHDKKNNRGAQRFFARGNTLGNQINFFFSVKREGNGSITICDLLGKRVHEICFTLLGVIDNQNSSLVAQWDLKNKNGRRVASGVYLAVLTVTGDNGRKERYIAKIGVKEY